MTDDNLLLYWIQLGRIEYGAAIDTAKRIGDDELLLYGLVKYEMSVQLDTTMTGDEKESLLSSLNQQTEALKRSQEEKQKAIDEANSTVDGGQMP
jgi:uncharacterized membrane protein YukC